MTSATLILKAVTPVAFRAGRDNDSASTLDYLPGGTLRGALSAAHAVLRPAKKDEFAALFSAKGVRYGNGYPCTFEDDAESLRPVAVRPAPRTALTCKRCDGFRPAVENAPAEAPHGVRDGLRAMAAFVLSGEKNLEVLAPLQACGCQGCPSPLGPFVSFCRRSAAGIWQTPDVKRELRMRNGMSRRRGTTHEAILYSRAMLIAGTLFQVRMAGDTADLENLAGFVPEASDAGLIRVGNNRTRGLGGLDLRSWFPDCVESDLLSRANAFDSSFRDGARASADLRHAFYLPATLESDVILKDELFRYRGRLDHDWLQAETGIAGADLIFQAAAMRRVAGWNALWGLPKTDDWAIAAGSVFLFGLPHAPDQTELACLERLEREGTGARREEGFGRIRFADEFHLEVNGI